MPEVKKFEEHYISQELENLGGALSKNVRIYLIGGCGMIFRKLKQATKDVDIVFISLEGLKEVIQAAKPLGYFQVTELPSEYKELGATVIMRNKDGFQMDLFHRRVCRGLDVSDRMESLNSP